MEQRIATVERMTKETKISMTLNLDGTGRSACKSGIGFFDHMLAGFAKHGLFDLEMTCDGDLEVDCHHTVEDVGIVLGECVKKAVGDKKGIRRYGQFILPMDEALILCAVDLSGRPYYVSDVEYSAQRIGEFDAEMVGDFFYSVSYSAMMNLHFKRFYGVNNHHLAEASFKAFAKALDMATQREPRVAEVWSTKGTL